MSPGLSPQPCHALLAMAGLWDMTLWPDLMA